jgi:hypothetical protein
MEDFLILSAYWAKYPPLHVIARAYVTGGKRHTGNDFDALLRMAGIDPAKGGRSKKTER